MMSKDIRSLKYKIYSAKCCKLRSIVKLSIILLHTDDKAATEYIY